MTVHELQQEILRLKREKNICILAHAYQSQPVCWKSPITPAIPTG